MNNLNEIFLRANIQQIRSFLLEGLEGDIVPETYQERLAQSEKRLMAWLSKEYPDCEEFERVYWFFFDFLNTTQDVYMEIGLQAGIMLATQIWGNFKAAVTVAG